MESRVPTEAIYKKRRPPKTMKNGGNRQKKRRIQKNNIYFNENKDNKHVLDI
jgi:hypothetical protein